MPEVLVGRVKSFSITPQGGSALTITGVRKASMMVDPKLEEDWDPQANAPDHWQGNPSKTLTITTRDRQLAIAMLAMPCISALTCILAKPRRACDSRTTATQITIAGTNLVCTSPVPIDAGDTDVPQDYDLTFTVGREDGEDGTLTATVAA